MLLAHFNRKFFFVPVIQYQKDIRVLRVRDILSNFDKDHHFIKLPLTIDFFIQIRFRYGHCFYNRFRFDRRFLLFRQVGRGYTAAPFFFFLLLADSADSLNMRYQWIWCFWIRACCSSLPVLTYLNCYLDCYPLWSNGSNALNLWSKGGTYGQKGAPTVKTTGQTGQRRGTNGSTNAQGGTYGQATIVFWKTGNNTNQYRKLR